MVLNYDVVSRLKCVLNIFLFQGFEGVLVVDGEFEGQSVLTQTAVCSPLINCVRFTVVNS